MQGTKNKVAVVAVDFSEHGDHALSLGLAMLRQGELSTLHLAHVLDPRDVIDDPQKRALQTEEEIIELAPRTMLARAAALVVLEEGELQRLKPHARIGRAVPTLIQICVDYEADVLIVGTHARRGMERVLLGSVAEALVRDAPCPVLVARPKDYEARSKTPLPDPPYAPGEAPVAAQIPFERTLSTSTDSWRPADNGPTGYRIV